jgi:NAD(P)-dependent dehydrogenase (short-subunit alcohol dehydrogenase family)
MGEFENRTVLITGVGKGIGRDLAEAFAAQGARVAANDITPINLDETVELIHFAGGQARALPAL